MEISRPTTRSDPYLCFERNTTEKPTPSIPICINIFFTPAAPPFVQLSACKPQLLLLRPDPPLSLSKYSGRCCVFSSRRSNNPSLGSTCRLSVAMVCVYHLRKLVCIIERGCSERYSVVHPTTRLSHGFLLRQSLFSMHIYLLPAKS